MLRKFLKINGFTQICNFNAIGKGTVMAVDPDTGSSITFKPDMKPDEVLEKIDERRKVFKSAEKKK